MSLHAKPIVDNPFYGSRAVATLVSLTLQLIVAAAVLVPGQTIMALGIEVETGAVLFMALWLRNSVTRIRRPPEAWAQMPRSRQVGELSYALLGNVLVVCAGVSLVAEVGGSLYLLAVWMLMAFGFNIYVAWGLIAEVSE